MKAGVLGAALAVVCAQAALGAETKAPAGPAQYDAVIAKHAAANGVPEALIRRVIVRESRYNPSALNRGHYGMMQIKPATARAMGYQGAPSGLLDADVNLTYGVRYLAGAYKVAGGNHDRAVRFYASGYYYDAKRKGMLAAIGMGRDGKRASASTVVATAAPVAGVQASGVQGAVPVTAQPSATAPRVVATTSASVARPPAPETPKVAAAPRVLSPTTAPVLASVAPVAQQTAKPAAATRVAAAADAVGGLSRPAVREAPLPGGVVAYAGGRSAPSDPFQGLAPGDAAATPTPPLPPVAPARPATPTAGVADAKAARVPAVVVAASGVPLPPAREPGTTASVAAVETAPKPAPRSPSPMREIRSR